MFKKKIKIVFIGFVVFVLMVSISNVYVSNNTQNKIYNNANTLPEMPVGIIFGAGISDGKPSKYLKDRLDAGILLFKTKKIEKILLSGDNGSDEHDELTVMKLYCYENGVDTTKIYLDYAGFDTYSTMYRAKRIFKLKKAILVSQAYHLKRAVFLGNKLGVNSVGFAADKGEYRGKKYVQFREFFSVFKAVIDVYRFREPKFLGKTVSIDSTSNYTKKITN